MKLCDVAQAYHPSSGGIKTYITEKRAYVERDGALGHVLVVPGGRHAALHTGPLTQYTVRGPGIPGCAPYRLLSRLDRVIAILARERPHVIELDSPYLSPWAAFWHRRRFPCAVVAFHHTDAPRAYVEPAARRLLGPRAGRRARRLALRYQRALYRACDLVITASPRVERRLRRLGVCRVATVPLGVDLDHFHPARRDLALRATLGVGPADRLLVYAGRLDTEKRPDLVADAVALLPGDFNAHLALVGEGPLKPALQRRAARDPRLHVLPYEGSRTALAALLASADVYVSAAPHETFGLSVVEAQASGLPVVGVRAGAMIERVPPEVGLLAEPGNAASLAGAVTALCRDDLRTRGARARQLVEARFSWRATFDRLIPLYQAARADALAGGRARGLSEVAQPAYR